jgi:hypothetical protein
MYIEAKGEGLTGPARIGRVTFSKSGRSVHYRGNTYQTLRGYGFKANYRDVATGEYFWISGCHKDGADHLYGKGVPVEIDDDVREEYWRTIREKPARAQQKTSW